MHGCLWMKILGEEEDRGRYELRKEGTREENGRLGGEKGEIKWRGRKERIMFGMS